MLMPILLPTYSPISSQEKIVEVDKHVDTVTIRKDLFDKYETFYKELSKFSNIHKYEGVFVQENPLLKFCGMWTFRISTDDPEELIKRIEYCNSKVVDQAIYIEKEINTHYDFIGIQLKDSTKELDYIKSKWWYKLFYKKKR